MTLGGVWIWDLQRSRCTRTRGGWVVIVWMDGDSGCGVRTVESSFRTGRVGWGNPEGLELLSIVFDLDGGVDMGPKLTAD